MWKVICKSDIKLRKKIRRQIRKIRKTSLASIIRDDFSERRTSHRPFHSTAMANVSNFIKTSGLQFAFDCGMYII